MIRNALLCIAQNSLVCVRQIGLREGFSKVCTAGSRDEVDVEHFQKNVVKSVRPGCLSIRFPRIIVYVMINSHLLNRMCGELNYFVVNLAARRS